MRKLSIGIIALLLILQVGKINAKENINKNDTGYCKADGIITDEELIKTLSEAVEEDGYAINGDTFFYYDTATLSNKEQITVICMRNTEGDTVKDTMIVPFESKENDEIRIIDVSEFLLKICNTAKPAGAKNSGSYTIGKAYVTGYYNKTTHSSMYYYQPYQLSYKVTSSVSVVSGIYRICGSPYSLDYTPLDQMDYPNYSISKTTGSPTVGTTYSKYAVCPRRYNFLGAYSTYHEIGVRFSSSGEYTTRDLDMTTIVM